MRAADSFSRVSAAVSMRVEDYFQGNKHRKFRIMEKGISTAGWPLQHQHATTLFAQEASPRIRMWKSRSCPADCRAVLSAQTRGLYDRRGRTNCHLMISESIGRSDNEPPRYQPYSGSRCRWWPLVDRICFHAPGFKQIIKRQNGLSALRLIRNM